MTETIVDGCVDAFDEDIVYRYHVVDVSDLAQISYDIFGILLRTHVCRLYMAKDRCKKFGYGMVRSTILQKMIDYLRMRL